MTVLTDKIEKISVSPSFLSGQDVQCTCYIFNIKKLLDEHIQVQNTFIRKWLWFIIRNKIMIFYWYIPLRPLNRLHQYWLHPTTKYPQKYNVSHFLTLPNLVYTDKLIWSWHKILSENTVYSIYAANVFLRN